MLMLLLVHLDAYGYDLICSLQPLPSDSPTSITIEATLSSSETQIEWADPDYRSHSSRPQYLMTYPDMILHWLPESCTQQTHHQPALPAIVYKNIAVHLEHCLFII